MCSYQTLYENDKAGYIIQCEECEKIQIAYNNLAITFKRIDFDAFRFLVLKVQKDMQSIGELPFLRSIILPLPCQGIQLLLNYYELSEFYCMLDEADTELQALEIIKLLEKRNFLNDI